MIYFDTDIWIHSLVEQDLEEHEQANQIIESYSDKVLISTLNYQEILFVLGKLKVSEIAKTHCSELITYNKKDFSKIAKLTPITIRML